MAISKMAKVLMVVHRSQVSQLLEALQQEGICQLLDSQESAIVQDMPELAAQNQKPKQIEETLSKINNSIAFLSNYAQMPKGLAAALAPRFVVGRDNFEKTVSDASLMQIVRECEQVEGELERLDSEIETEKGLIEELMPWMPLQEHVENLSCLEKAESVAGLIPEQNFETVVNETKALGTFIEKVGRVDSKIACIIVCLKDYIHELHKILRGADFELFSFEDLKGTVAQIIENKRKHVESLEKSYKSQKQKAKELAAHILKLQILADYNANLLNKEKTQLGSPSTEKTIVMEGWVKEADYKRLEQVIVKFSAASVQRIAPKETEIAPVEIENKKVFRPFESITRLYGLPCHFDIDPTAFLMPFFIIFFGLCLSDAGYALTMLLMLGWAVRKIQGDKKLMWLLIICSGATVVIGAIQGSWYGDAIQKFVPALDPYRKKFLLFDPFEKPMVIFAISVILGYIQIMTGLAIACVNNLMRRNYAAAVFEQMTWLLMINSIVIYGLGLAGFYVPPQIGKIFGYIALIPAAGILLFSVREGSWGSRLGMGFYNLFSAIFYVGDVLSYLRLMALGMVGSGIAMAMNVIGELVLKAPYGIGIVLLIIVFIGGHMFNLLLSALGAFVHTMRLQYIEFFQKFFVGGGREFQPFSKEYKNIYIKEM